MKFREHVFTMSMSCLQGDFFVYPKFKSCIFKKASIFRWFTMLLSLQETKYESEGGEGGAGGGGGGGGG